MLKVKYHNNYEGVEKAQKEFTEHPYTEADFDLADLRSSRFGDLLFTLVGWLFRWVIFPLSQRFRPVWSIFGITFVTRLEDVRTVLKAHNAFEVPFGREMEEMTGGPVFALGDDGEEHRLQIAAARAVWDKDKIISVTRDVIDDVTPALLDDSGGDINAATDVLMRVMSEACAKSFGLKVPNADRFAAYATACSIQLFADPFGASKTRKQAMIGAQRLRDILNANIDGYMNAPNAPTERGFMHDLIDQLGRDNPRTRDTTRAIIFGFITGFLPTVSLSAGKMLTHLRANPGLMAKAKRLAHAQNTDPAAFQQFLLEVGRHNPALFPGQMRRRNGTSEYFHAHLAKIPEDNLVFVCTGAAMHDVTAMKHPNRFNPEEGFLTKEGDTAPDLSFGAGLHVCFGTDEARSIIPSLLGILLRQPGIEFSKKRVISFGPYLGELRMSFDITEGHRVQAMMNAVIPLRTGTNGKALAAYLKSAREDRNHPIRQLFDTSGIVHFASLIAINLGKDKSLDADPTHLFVELNLDGTEDSSLAALCAAEKDTFAQILPYIEGDSPSFFRRVQARLLRPRTRPWGTIGVNFPGTSDSSVKQIRDEKALYTAARNELERIRRDSARPMSEHENPTAIIEQVRATLRQTPAFRQMMYRPTDRFPAFSRHEETPLSTFLFKYLMPRRRQILIGIYIAVTLVLPLLVALLCGLLLASYTYVALWTIPLFLLLTLLIVAVVLLIRAETSEKPDERFAPHDYVDRIKESEDLPDHVQNHITSVSDLKPGFFRKITTALSFDLIGQMVVLWFRPGFVTDFATIHYARWVRPAGVEKMIFQSNYDGSWESYLEDFITKVHPGQTMAWNNCIGFPKTRWFAFEGAEDGDAFKRWVRRQQVPTQFWYSRFPDATTGVIRANALVRDGLARAATFDEHKAWLTLFDSKPRPQHALDTSQIQTLLFRGLGRHKFMTAHMLEFEDIPLAKEWLTTMVSSSKISDAPGTMKPGELSFGDSYPNGDPSFIALTARGIQRLGFPDGPFDGRPTLPHAFVDGMARRPHVLGDTVSARADGRPDWRWSDAGVDGVLLVYARSAKELKKTNEEMRKVFKAKKICCDEKTCSVHADMEREEGRVFGFRDGISQPVMRGTQVHAKGNASDDDVVDPGEFILGYPDTRGHVQPPVTVARNSPAASTLPSMGGAVDGLVPSFGTEKTNLSDFGRNGSFLVIRQFLHDDQAFDRFTSQEAIRVEEQDPDYRGFKGAKSEDERSLTTDTETRELHRKAWIGAKLFGRWPDGSSLTRNPSMSATTRNRARFYQQIERALFAAKDQRKQDKIKEFQDRMGTIGEQPQQWEDLHIERSIWKDDHWDRFMRAFEDLQKDLTRPLDVDRTLLNPIVPDNDFRHGTEDPQGLNCPIGAHIRRSNPRDSFRPGDEITLEINNRHRLLRRGRTFYGENDQGAPENGSFFMCFNSNLERQFEFVQQTWIDSRFFHGGREGPDPIVTAKKPGDRHVIPGASEGTFLEMHTGSGHRDFVHVVGGGYFFMPSRQALEYLSRL